MTNSPLLREHILYLVYHVFLPRQLPVKDDTKPAQDDALVRIVLDSFRGFSALATGNAVQCTLQMMVQMAAVHETGQSYSVAECRLGDALAQLRESTQRTSIPVYVAAQNAGVIFTTAAPDIHCEVFELSPPNKDVMTVTGRLRRSFPASSVAISQKVFDRRLCTALASTLAKLSQQEVAGTKPKAKKEKKMHDEERDTTDPKMVTMFLATLLLAHGRPAHSKTITKNTREEVMYRSSLLPWRRSSTWLLLRVALQLSLSRCPTAAAEDGALYKDFMLYFLADILREAVYCEIESDLLYSMYAKLERRLRKHVGHGAVRTYAQAAMTIAITTLEKRWALIQEQDSGCVKLTGLFGADWRADTRATLPELDEYIRACGGRKGGLAAVDFQPGSIMTQYTPLELPNLSNSRRNSEPFDLLSFENWVAEHLDSWLAAHISDNDVCQSLAARFYEYHARMTRLYAQDPESMSIMTLTLVELWVACDKAAVHNCWLLDEYDTGVPSHLLQCLLLPLKADMERLGRIEAYLARRTQQATFEASDIFTAFGTVNCFAVRWFTQSQSHHALRERIEASAQEQRERKRAELKRCKDRYRSLLNLHNSSDHNDTSVWVDWSDTWENQHVPNSCEKCKYLGQANAIKINIHEWPLPQNELQAHSTVFELDVPPSFGHWRDLTLFLKLDVLQGYYSNDTKPRCQYTLNRFQGLAGFFVSWSATQRSVLLSQDKPHSETHRKSRHVNSATLDSDICLENALHYAYYDSDTSCFVDHVCFSGKLETLCMYTMPPESASLQQFLHRPAEQASGPSPNTAVASKSVCPDHFDEDEYVALCTVPLGNRIQWTNILVQLHAPAVVLKKVETLLTLLQCMLQAGPPGFDVSKPRENHAIADEARFATKLLDGLNLQLQHVQANWQATYAIMALICLGCRLCTLTPDTTVRIRCLEFLARCRTVVLDWLAALQNQVAHATEKEARCALRSKVVVVAMICLCTFDLDQEILVRTLNSRENASALIRCAIVVREGHNSVAPDSAFLHILQRRVQRLQHRSYKRLSAYIVGEDAETLHGAVRQLWPAYQATGEWCPLPTYDYWLETRSGNQGIAPTLQVHLNLLDGDLRVSGEPLGRLPDEYLRHPTYRALFGQSRLEVMPSALPGMRFSGRNTFYNYTVHFGLAGEDLVLHASRGDRCYELVPRRLLNGCYPTSFTNDHVLWYDALGDCVEFRRNGDAWDASAVEWVLKRAGGDDAWQLQNDGRFLLSVQSNTAMLVSKPLEPLEDPAYMHCLLHTSDTSDILEVYLPRLQLEFSARPDDCKLSSRQYRGLFVDPAQSAGTFIGLKNKLILRGDEDCRRRIVLVPNGSVSYVRAGGHVHVSIQKGAMKRVESYEIDSQLGRLQDRGSHENMLYQCYLHALTAFCLPDPLTGATGTEQALVILNGAAMHSFEYLSETSIYFLKQIADLTPARRYYPAHLGCMQVVRWSSNLGFLAQHDSFQTDVRALYRKHDDMRIFAMTSHAPTIELQEVNETLWLREMNRSAAVRISGFGAESFNLDRDVYYAGRGEWQDSNATRRVFSITSFLLRRNPRPFYNITLDLVSHAWSYLFSANVYSTASPSVKLEYDACWLVESQPFISQEWLRLHSSISRERTWGPTGDIIVWLATLAFADSANISILHILACFYIMPEMASITLPRAPIFYIGRGYTFDDGALRQSIRQAHYPLERCPSVQLTQYYKEKGAAFKKRQMRALKGISNPLCEEIVHELRRQWPCERPSLAHSTSAAAYFHMTRVQNAAQELFNYWNDNIRFRQYLSEVANCARVEAAPLDMDSPSCRVDKEAPERRQGFVAAADIFSHAAPMLESFQALNLQQYMCPQFVSGTQETAMAELIAQLQTSATWPYEVQYVQHLESSSRSVQNHDQRWKIVGGAKVLAAAVASLRTQSRVRVDYIYSAMRQAIGAAQAEDDGSIHAWPRITPLFFLQQLAQSKWAVLPAGWRDCIVEYGCAVTALQRAERLAAAYGDTGKFIAELQNPGHTDWNPREHPEWLLLEVENGILIRPVQHQIAMHMSTPGSGANEIMQLIMGGGKSSVIVPMVALALADGRRLVRVIVAKPQAKQMFAMLVAKLGRLLDRRVFLIPFSRDVRLQPLEMGILQRLYQQCMATSGVLLVQPEHILSFQLMAVEKCIGSAAEAQSMLQTLQFLHNHARDIIDESDDVLSVRYELVYTMGAQRAVDHAPSRWLVIAEVLDMVRRCVPMVQARWPDAVEVHPGHDGCFPRTRILRQDAMSMLQTLVATYVCDCGMTGFPIAQQPKEVRSAVRRYITQPHLTEEEIALVEVRSGFVTEETRDTLLLLRGLLVQGILSFVLEKKRWRVDYGLDPARLRPTRLAVPFRAKDLPTDRSEFSHPDVVIALTSLCYYYAGLSDNDLVMSLRHLQQSDQADMEYQDWINDAPNLPSSLQQLASINLDDENGCASELFRCFRRAKSAIDYFLAHLVFPKEMKVFPHKLSVSGWDIAAARNNPTTGFSGTNDSRVVLPLSVQQIDLDEQTHTNALVLAYLLQPENLALPMLHAPDGVLSDAERLLATVTALDPPVRVILDVGAQILELDNIGVAQAWLSILCGDETAQAAVFVDKEDHICVLDRKGYVEPLHTSPFATQLDTCVVFLDEAHTRGIDLALPRYYRAAVTIGTNLTKDRLVQACMRMRRLGHGQSVIFCVPREICAKLHTSQPTVTDILQWVIQGTWEDAARSVPLWAVQGRRHHAQSIVWTAAHTDDGALQMTRSQASQFLEQEAISMETRYAPRMHTAAAADDDDPISQRFRAFKPMDHFAAALSEEQERELSPEIEREREVQRAAPEKPAPHALHPDMVTYVATGRMALDSSARMLAFASLSATSAARYLDLDTSPRHVYVSRDFAQTVEGGGSDCTQRPVQWILVSPPRSQAPAIDTMVVISPYEAQMLLPAIQKSTRVVLCLYAPRPNQGYRALDALDLYTVPEQPAVCVPPQFTIGLNIFAGQLYFSSELEAIRVCHYLGINLYANDVDAMRRKAAMLCSLRGFTQSPTKFLQVFLSQVRRGCSSIGKTHMGCILDSRRPKDL